MSEWKPGDPIFRNHITGWVIMLERRGEPDVWTPIGDVKHDVYGSLRNHVFDNKFGPFRALTDIGWITSDKMGLSPGEFKNWQRRFLDGEETIITRKDGLRFMLAKGTFKFHDEFKLKVRV